MSSHAPTTQVQSSPQEDELRHFVGFVFDDVQRSWRAQIPGYTDAHLVLFRRAIRSACGTASTAVGPFYARTIEKVYLDLSFFDELSNKLGAPGQFAQAYVIAHELGHHIQTLEGILGASGSSVPIELRPIVSPARGPRTPMRGILERGDVDQALNAASQIGDDTLQRKHKATSSPRRSRTARRHSARAASRRATVAAPGLRGPLADAGGDGNDSRNGAQNARWRDGPTWVGVRASENRASAPRRVGASRANGAQERAAALSLLWTGPRSSRVTSRPPTGPTALTRERRLLEDRFTGGFSKGESRRNAARRIALERRVGLE